MTIEEQIANIDRGIRDHEAALSHLNEKRRELVNRGYLNKQAQWEEYERRCKEWS